MDWAMPICFIILSVDWQGSSDDRDLIILIMMIFFVYVRLLDLSFLYTCYMCLFILLIYDIMCIVMMIEIKSY